MIGDFWRDFSGSEFDPQRDRFALITLLGTKLLLHHFNSLLDLARTASNQEDFHRRIKLNGSISNEARSFSITIRKMVDEAAETPVTDKEFWSFLSSIHVLSFDLNTATGQTEAAIKGMLALSASSNKDLETAETTWLQLLELTGREKPLAKNFSYDDLPENLRALHEPINTRSSSVLQAISKHSSISLNQIKTTIAQSGEIARENLVSKIVAAVNENQVTVISAPAGYGKSAAAKQCLDQIKTNDFCVAFILLHQLTQGKHMRCLLV